MLDPALLEPERTRPLARLLSRREYEDLVELGIFEDQRLELLRGELVEMSPQGDAHSTITARIAQRLIRALDDTYEVRSHSPFAATEDSEPEPDVSVSRRRRGNYHPRKALLLVEVAESSLKKDRRIKSAIYAENRAPEYWVVDLRTTSAFVYTQPVKGVYQSIAQLRRKDLLRPVLLPGITIAVSELFRSR